MKQFVRVLTAVLCTFAVAAVYAGPPECKEPPGQIKDRSKPEKVSILHCGCPDAGEKMFYVEIRVSSKSKGHLKHGEAPTVASCSDGSDEFFDFVRAGADCQLEGDDYLPMCLEQEGQFVGAECGMMAPG